MRFFKILWIFYIEYFPLRIYNKNCIIMRAVYTVNYFISKFLGGFFAMDFLTSIKERAKKNKNVPKAPIATMINNDDVIMATPIFNT